MPAATALGIGGREGVGPVAERQDGLVHTGRRQVGEHPFEQRDLDDGQELLGSGVGQGTKPGPLAAHQDDGFHLRAARRSTWSCS